MDKVKRGRPKLDKPKTANFLGQRISKERRAQIDLACTMVGENKTKFVESAINDRLEGMGIKPVL